jgi:hypothetical protein
MPFVPGSGQNGCGPSGLGGVRGSRKGSRARIPGNETCEDFFGITPVWTSSLYFPGQGFTIPSLSKRTYLCPGTPINFTEYTLVDRFQLDFSFPAMQLPRQPTNSFLNFNQD